MSRDDKIDAAFRILSNMAGEFDILSSILSNMAGEFDVLSSLFRVIAEKLDGVADSNNEDRIDEVLETYKELLGLETFKGLDLPQKAECLNITSNRGMSPLMFAASHGDDQLVRALIESGADVDASNQDGNTAEEMAIANGHTNLAGLLEQSSRESLEARMIPLTEEQSEAFRELGIQIERGDPGSGRARLFKGSSENTAAKKMGKDVEENKENETPGPKLI